MDTSLQHRQYHCSRPRLGSGRKRGTHRRALGRSRGGFTSKLHCLADALGRTLAFHLTVGEAADCKAYDALTDLLERAPDALLAGKGYDADVGANATGNSVTGYACSTCGGDLNANSVQVNNGNINAVANTVISGSSRHVISGANAVGNAASFYVTGNGGG